MRPAFVSLCTLALLAACATFPDLRGRPEPPATQSAYPTLLPIDALLAQVPPQPPADPGAAVSARAAQLRARAAALQAAE